MERLILTVTPAAMRLVVVVLFSLQWGITLEGSSADAEESDASKEVNKGGLSFEYDAATSSAASAPVAAAATPTAAAPVPEEDLTELFAALRSAQK